jgi:hypothetical protein
MVKVIIAFALLVLVGSTVVGCEGLDEIDDTHGVLAN